MHADFDAKMRKLLLECASFNWSAISPAIFGSMFQGVMDKQLRRALGAHYTSEENILKLINPLFMDELWAEWNRVKTDPLALNEFHSKIGKLKFLDPACGCGNFLIIAYRELRRLELEILKMKAASQTVLAVEIEGLLKVGVEQFYGIEIEDFPCQIAQVGMWLMDHQMNLQASEILGSHYVRLPLTRSATIIHGNALRMDWEDVVPKSELSYIMGNPPFVGHKNVTTAQKEDMIYLFEGKQGRLDFVAAWYKKAAALIQETSISCAFVSTNTVVQGVHIETLWGLLFKHYRVNINFAHRTFKWSNEAKGKASVYCVIIGFSALNESQKRLFFYSDVSGQPIEASVSKINAYLDSAASVIITSRSSPLCNVPAMIYGNIPRDGGHYTFTSEEKDIFVSLEPLSQQYMYRFLGSKEFINNSPRWILFLRDCPPNELRNMPYVIERVSNVSSFRLSSKAKEIQKFAKTPTLFAQTTQAIGKNFILIPIISSERRQYIPIGFVNGNTIVNNQVQTLPEATLYHFGILTSSVHMGWTRTVCGRLEMRYRYSKDIVYNNFPWPQATEAQMDAISEAAQKVLDAREAFPDSSLADLYDPNSMPVDLTKAHEDLDRLVMRAYGFSSTMTEAEIVAKLFEMYQTLAEGKH